MKPSYQEESGTNHCNREQMLTDRSPKKMMQFNKERKKAITNQYGLNEQFLQTEKADIYNQN